MLKGENIICISSIDWDFIWQGHQEIMSTFAENSNRVLFIENTGTRSPSIDDIGRILKRMRNWFNSIKGYRKEKENLYIYSPIVLPFPYSTAAQWINKHILLNSLKRWMRITNFQSPVIWTFLPTATASNIIKNIENKMSIYYCIDNFRVSSYSARKIKNSEIEMIKLVDRVFVTSQKLFEYVIQYKDASAVSIFPFGVNINGFKEARENDPNLPEDMKNIKHPIVGYIGGIHKWMDKSLIKFLADRFKEISFVFIGPEQTDVSDLKKLNNMYFLGKKEHTRLPDYAYQFDVGIIPYSITPYTENVYPTKMNEYLALGKPVVSTALPEVEIFNNHNEGVVYIGKDYEDFSANIVNALKEDGDGKKMKRITAAEKNGWQNRIEEMSVIINKVIEDKRHRGEVGWERILVGIYNSARRRVVKVSFAILFLYYLVFYSPLIWYMAEPLKIIQQPVKADAIVVFGGGAGESGVPGQGYEERVTHAVDLFKKGYAGHIIFSSGYTNILKEPDVMKALAISLGMPAGAIITEVNSSNTYKNVLNVKEILKEKGWNRILLISSPYHMRRVSMVFNKNAKEINVIYTPVPSSQFYNYDISSRGSYFFREATLRQLRGFNHEYLGIIYYWWKGYI
ncbi:MAG: ElyC/SanA/YdcF family protein [Nitrospinota bacterium]